MMDVKDMETEILTLCEETGICARVCKAWNAHMEARKAAIKKAFQENILLVTKQKSGELIKTRFSQGAGEFELKALEFIKASIDDMGEKDFFSVKLIKHAVKKISNIKSLEFKLDDGISIGFHSHKQFSKVVVDGLKKTVDDLIYFDHYFGYTLAVFNDILIIDGYNKNRLSFKNCNVIEFNNNKLYFEFQGGIYQTSDFKSIELVKWITEM